MLMECHNKEMRLAIVEYEDITLKRLHLILESEYTFNIVGAYSSAEEALSNIDKSIPDVMIIDLRLPHMSGVELMMKIKKKYPFISLLAYSGFHDRETVLSVFKAGASGFIIKGTPIKDLIEAINDFQSGGIPMSSKIARIIINELCCPSVNDTFALTGREQGILKSVEKDLSYKEIAEKFDISRHTVHTHIKNIYKKLEVNCKKEAIHKARRNGLI